jgi:hypothetical protein
MKTEISIDPLGGKRLNQLLALFVASALIPSTLLAQAVDQFKGDKGHDPTGAWLIKGAVYSHRFSQRRNLNRRRPGRKRF